MSARPYYSSGGSEFDGMSSFIIMPAPPTPAARYKELLLLLSFRLCLELL